MRPILIFLTAFLASCASAERCSDKTTQQAMNRCAQSELEIVEKKLSTLLHQYSSILEDEQFTAAQKRWADYRKSHCSSVSNIYSGGSVYEFVLLNCKINLTEQRITSLKTDYEDTINIINRGSP